MKRLDLQQRTFEWEEFRRQGIGSSDAAILLNSKPFGASWDELKLQKLGLGSPIPETQAMKEGREEEPLALGNLLKENALLAPCCGIHETFEYIRCSFDAFDGKEIHEIKSPGPKNLAKILFDKEMPSKWIDQVKWQMLVADLSHGFIQIWDREECHPFLYEMDPSWKKRALSVAKEFWDWVNDGKFPELEDSRYTLLESHQKSTILREYESVVQKRKELEKTEKELKNKLIEGMDCDFILDDVKFYQTTTSSYDIEKMVVDYHINKDLYRKESKPFWKIAL